MIGFDQAGRGLEWSTLAAPPESLVPWVEHCWVTWHPRQSQPGPSWKIVPDLSAHLLVHDHGGERRVRLVGARSRAIDIDVGDRSWSVGVRLAPGALPRLTGLPATELTDTGAGPSVLWDRDGTELADRLQHAPGPREVLGLVTGFLARRLAAADRVDWKARAAVGDHGDDPPPDVATLAKRSGLSRRCLQRSTAEQVGLSPKTILRVRRLYRTLAASLATPAPDWSRIALSAGFYDGAHLAREFRLLLGEPPTAWRARAESSGA